MVEDVDVQGHKGPLDLLTVNSYARTSLLLNNVYKPHCVLSYLDIKRRGKDDDDDDDVWGVC